MAQRNAPVNLSGPDLAAALAAARTEYEATYAQARRLVYNRLPPGAPDLSSLNDEQRRVLERTEAAEAAYDRLRLRWHREPGNNAARSARSRD